MSGQLMCVWAMFTVVRCLAEGGEDQRTDVGHELA